MAFFGHWQANGKDKNKPELQVVPRLDNG